ncbi:SET domain-containing protein 8 [Wickerhamiella sorbophila]|uniref:SET domain-containing protein 8 n=1 Tax=Wickerhamiella sorbophila TaxID=45607 RepID=A0A2T0FNW5_9ASCO|nr:SET domain-containing protein 8 [Wickerhamiella sorbophila]PRT56649.1 SET domain-containing protein 8 [Wickerhamiella sorbophila]
MADDRPTVIENRAEVFEKWAKHYTYLDGDVVDSFGLGLASSRNVAEGTTLAKVPESLTISERIIDDLSLQDEKLAKWLNLQPVSDRHRLHRALVYLALNTPTKWLVYFKLLPTNGDINLPFSWTDDNLQQLKGSSIYEPVASKKSIVEVQYYEFCELAKPLLEDIEIPFSLWVLAYQWVSSRSLTNPESGQSILAPIIDLCNHSSHANVRYDLQGTDFVLLATRDIAKGEELVLDYGSRGSGEFLFNYGFIPEKQFEEITRIYDPDDEAIRRLLDPSRDPDCPDDLKKEMEFAYNLLTQFLPQPMQVLKLNSNGEWADEFITLVACEDLVELKTVDGQYSLYIRDTELVPGQIAEQTKQFSEVAYRAKILVAQLAHHFASKLAEEKSDSVLPVVKQLHDAEAKLYQQFIDAAKDLA